MTSQFFQPGNNLVTQNAGLSPENLEVPFIANYAPTSNNIALPGKRWLYLNNGEYVNLGNSSIGGVLQSNWATFTSATGDLETLSDQSSTIVTPSSNNIQLNGTAGQITTTAGSHVITWSFPSAVTMPGSLAVTTTLAVTGATTLSAGLSGTTATFSSTLHAGGATTLGSTLAVTGATTLSAGLSGTTATFSSTLHAGGATTLGSTLAVTSTISGTTITGSTGFVATTGNITATLGNLVATAGNLDLNGAASKININVGTTASASAGTGTLTSGVLAITTTAATASSLVYATYINYTSALGGILEASSISGTVTITSSDLTDSTSTVQWFLIN